MSGICGYANEITKSGAGIVLPEPFDQKVYSEALSDMIERLPQMRMAAETASARLQAQRGRWLTVIDETVEKSGAP